MSGRRERFFAAVGRREPDRVPMEFSLCPSQVERFRRETGADDYRDYFDLEMRYVGPGPRPDAPDFSAYHGELPENTHLDELGIGHWNKNPELHFEQYLHPLAACESVAWVEDYPLPDFADARRYAGLQEEVANRRDQDYAVIGSCAHVGGTVFWPAYKLRGMEAHVTDLLLRPEVAEALLERVTKMSVALARGLTAAGVDALFLADDFGTQQSLIVSPDLFRRWYKPRLQRVIEAARSVRSDILILFHSDGAVAPLVRDFIDMGVDVLNPVQPECMDPAEIKREYGNDLSFWGTIGTQTTLPFGTPDEVKRVVRERIATVGAGGGLIIGPTHVVEPEAPWENLLAFVEAVREC
jgi:uroporphyrinogen decarboxylase